MKVIVDVDLTVCPIDVLWWEWLNTQLKTNYSFPVASDYNEEKLNYDLGFYFGDEIEKRKPYKKFCSLDFFRSESLYDYVGDPISGSVDCLSKLHHKGCEIIFVSHIKGNHHKSKYLWLKRHFPFMSGFLATKEKYFVSGDVIIDDRIDHINNYISKNKNARAILYDTEYEQKEKLLFNDNVFASSNWDYIYYLIEDFLPAEDHLV